MSIATETINITATGETTLEAKLDGDIKMESLAYTGGRMRLKGFRYEVIVDLEGLSVPQGFPYLLDHQNEVESIVGHGSAQIRDYQLWTNGILAVGSKRGGEILSLHKSGVKFQASIGAEVHETEDIPPKQPFSVNGQSFTFNSPVTVVRKAKLNEVSIVPMGADSETMVHIAAAFNLGNKSMTKETNTQEPESQQANTGGGITTVTASNSGNITKIQTEADDARLQAERDRVSKINQICDGKFPKIQAAAIEEGWDIEKTQNEALEALRSSRNKAPSGITVSGPSEGQVIEASLCMTAGMSEEEAGKFFDEKTMNCALSSQNRDTGLHDVLLHVIEAAGHHNPSRNRVTNDTIRAAFEADRVIRASQGWSTISLPGILSNMANKSMLSAYNAVKTTWQHFCRVETNSDFKKHTRYRLTGKGGYQPVNQAGELESVSLQESQYESQIGTAGCILSITREMWVNDDMGALSQLQRIHGRMGAIDLEKAVYKKLLSNEGSFFHADNNNYFDGADSVLGIDSLTTADQYFEDQTDANGDPIMIEPSILLVPSTLKTKGRQLVRETTVEINPAQDTPTPSGNPHAGAYKPVSTPWLNNQNLSGSSATAWYLLTGPNDVAIMEVAFLNGKRVPMIETSESDFSTLGHEMRSYHDFGVAMGDTHGGVKSKGAA